MAACRRSKGKCLNFLAIRGMGGQSPTARTRPSRPLRGICRERIHPRLLLHSLRDIDFIPAGLVHEGQRTVNMNPMTRLRRAINDNEDGHVLHAHCDNLDIEHEGLLQKSYALEADNASLAIQISTLRGALEDIQNSRETDLGVYAKFCLETARNVISSTPA